MEAAKTSKLQGESLAESGWLWCLEQKEGGSWDSSEAPGKRDQDKHSAVAATLTGLNSLEV